MKNKRKKNKNQNIINQIFEHSFRTAFSFYK